MLREMQASDVELVYPVMGETGCFERFQINHRVRELITDPSNFVESRR